MAFSAYRDSIRTSLSHWPELAWLNRFLQTAKPNDGDRTFAHVFELIDNHFVASEAQFTATSLAQAIETKVQASRLRIVLICHGQSWDVDRDIVDVVCSKYSIDPRFMARHFNHSAIRFERNCPGDIGVALQRVDHLSFNNQYSWDLGGEIMSPLSMQSGSCFFFAYEGECLSLAVHRERFQDTALLFLRASSDQLMDTSRIFFHRPNLEVTRSTLLRMQISKSLAEEFLRALSELEYPQETARDVLIGEAVLPYIISLFGCCSARYHRDFAPTALDAYEDFRIRSGELYDEVYRIRSLRRETEAFVRNFFQSKAEKDRNLAGSHEVCRVLSHLEEDLKDLLSLYRANDGRYQSQELGELTQAQIDQAKEAKDTSVSLGYLSRLAYMTLPLQLTASAMGMNLRVFGTGNIELRTVLSMLLMLASLSFIPLLIPLLFGPMTKRLFQLREVARYSQRVAFLFGWFCLFHRRETNDQVFVNSGMRNDLHFFKGVHPERRKITGERWPYGRNPLTAGSEGYIAHLFPHDYWKGVLDEIFEVIDSPRWRKRGENDHNA